MDTQTATQISGNYTIDPVHSQIVFGARHAMVTKVRGLFTDFEGTGYFNADHPEESHFKVKIRANSLNTNNADRDKHLRSNDFFDMENHPEITFASTKFSRLNEETFHVVGDLTIRGVTKSIEFDLHYTGTAVDPFGNRRIGLEGSTTVNRKDWGLNWNAALETGGFLVSEQVTLEFDVSAIRAADQESIDNTSLDT